MPIVHDISLNLNKKEVLRRGGIKRESAVSANMGTLLGELLARTTDEQLLEPAIAFEIYPITKINQHELRLKGDAALDGSLLSSALEKAKELAAVVCTIGPRLEQEVKKCIDRNEPLRGLLLDGIGSAAIDKLAQEVCRLIGQIASATGHQASSSLNPGMPGFPLSEQRHLFELAPAVEIGVSLAPSGLMVPRKSLSMVIGIGPKMRTWTQDEVCASCTLKKTCHYKYTRDHETTQKYKQKERDGSQDRF